VENKIKGNNFERVRTRTCLCGCDTANFNWKVLFQNVSQVTLGLHNST